MGKLDVIQKTGSTYFAALSSEKYRATATVDMYRRFREVWTCGF